MAKSISQEEFQKEVLEFDGTVLIDFWAPWCGPCRIQGPIVDKISEQFSEDKNVKILKMNVDENNQLSQAYNIRSIPTLLLFKNGEMLDAMIGLQTEELLEKKVKASL